MGAKRALIVDDSRSARLFLARMLEKYEIDVDSAENAEAAIDYLGNHRPDVIFMDHMMPGMDGFQAVQAIKNNPRTATIPIMMYTSQEGELYLGQARALGAVGVLPKQIKPTDVSKVLYQLHLVPDRRTSEQTSFRPVSIPTTEVTTEEGSSSAAPAPRVLTETSLREQFAELRRALVAGIDTQTDRITAEVRAILLESLPPPAASQPAKAERPWGWIVASVALAIAFASTLLWWRDFNLLRSVARDLDEVRAEVAAQRAAQVPAAPVAEALPSAPESPEGGATPTPSVASSVAPGAAGAVPAAGQGGAGATQPRKLAAPGKPTVLAVPYGADALGGTRLDAVRQLLDRLARQNTSGVVEIKTYPGRFCLMGNPTDGYSVAPEETLYSKCDVVGNPTEEAQSPAQRTPLAFANLVGSVRNSTHGTLDVQVAQGDASATASPYPPPSAELTAGEWNRAASANNRIEIRLR